MGAARSRLQSRARAAGARAPETKPSLPTTTAWPSTSARTPWPGIASKPRPVATRSRVRRRATTAWPADVGAALGCGGRGAAALALHHVVEGQRLVGSASPR